MYEEKTLTGYPSIDKPWLKYYSSDYVNLPLPECKIFDYCYEENKNNMQLTALNYFGKKITYNQMFNSIDKVAAAFSRLGVVAGEIVPIIAVTIPEIVYTFYALNRIGAVSNMIDPRTGINGIKSYIDESESKTIVVLDLAYQVVLRAIGDDSTVKNIIIVSAADSLPHLTKILYRLSNHSKIAYSANVYKWIDFVSLGANQQIIDSKYKKNSDCVIVHTGGTTGVPKGVILTDDNLNAAAQQILKSPLPLVSGDRFLNIMPLFIAYGTVLGIHSVHVGGLESILIPKFNPSDFAKILLKYHPSCVMGVPSHFDLLMKDKAIKANTDLSFLKVAFVGGDKIKRDIEEQVNSFFEEHGSSVKISKGYSLTEASATATFASPVCNRVESVGLPLSKTTISAFEGGLDRELKCGEIGDLYISSPTIMKGYHNNEKETDQIIKFRDDGTRWLYTGDYGYVDTDGSIFVLGRKKRIIVRHDGFKVFPSQIEDVIEKDDRVIESCVVGIDDKSHNQGKLPYAFLVISEKGANNEEQVIASISIKCNEFIPEYARPVEFKVIDRLPVTPIGKVDYRALEKLAEEKNDD